MDAIANQIFISFTHKDNAKLRDDEQGWIDRFHEALQERINQLWGSEIPIWRDPKIRGNDLLTAAIEAALQRSAVVVSVLSPGYVKSDWCKKEIAIFSDLAKRSGGVNSGAKSRILKAIKTPVETPSERPLADLNDSRGYSFYRLTERGVPWEFDPRLGAQARQAFLNEVNELAYDLRETLGQWLKSGVARKPIASPTNQTVYLAETSFDLASDADQLRRELEQFGHTVLPDVPLTYVPEYATRVRQQLARASMSIHQVGTSYGIIPEGDERSVVALAYELGREEALRRPDFKRVPWMPPGNVSADPRQRAFIEALRDDPELLVAPLESLKTHARELLAAVAKPEKPVARRNVSNAQASLYFICDPLDISDPIDFESVKVVENWLFERDIEVTRPLVDGSETQMREDHIEQLKMCDAVLIYHGRTTEFWRRTKLLDLQKVFGLGRTRPFKARGVLMADPITLEKQSFRSIDVSVVRGFQGANPEILEPFLERVCSGDRVP